MQVRGNVLLAMNNNLLNEKLFSYFEVYDSIDLISKFSAMNLEFENQNKNLLTSYVTTFGLFNVNNGKPKASNKTIKQIIDILNKAGILPSIQDPAESLFVEPIFLDKEYKVFNGINTSSAYYLNSIIEVLLYRRTSLNADFKNRLIRYIKFILEVSQQVYEKAEINSDYYDHGYFEDLLFPQNLDKKQKALFFNAEFYKAYISDEEFKRYFLCDVEGRKLKYSLDEEYPFYYKTPFMKINDEYLLLDPTCLTYFLKMLCLDLADEYGIKDLYIEEFNSAVFSISLERAKMISGITPYAENEISSVDSKNIKSKSYKLGDSKAVLIFYYCQTKESTSQTSVDSDIRREIQKILSAGINKNKIYSIILINSYFGTCNFSSGFKFENQPMIVSCSELQFIQNNEKNDPYFLETYSHFLNYYFPQDSTSMIFSQTNLISVLNDKHYDFYMSDDIKIKGNLLNLGFDFIYPYALKFIKDKCESCSVFDGIDVPLRLVKYEDNIYFPNPIICPVQNVKPLIVKVGRYGFWIYSKNNDENGILISRVIAYWMNQIQDRVPDFIVKYYYVQIEIDDNKLGIVRINENRCRLLYTRKYIEAYSNSNNENEVEIVLNILKTFDLLSNDVASALYDASNKENKKIIYLIDQNKNPYIVPLNQHVLPIRSSKIYESILDDQCGEFISEKHIPYGLIKDPSVLLHSVVDFLFSKLEFFVSQFSWLGSLEKCYLHCESILEELLLFQDNMKHQFALYPEHRHDIEENFNNINASSVCIRFLIEYISAVRPNGNNVMDDVDIQYAMSIISAIIKWARLDDSLKCGIVKEFNFLKSCRIGYDHSGINKFNEIVSETASFDTTHSINAFDYSAEFPFKSEIDLAYDFEHGFTTQQLMVVMTIFAACGSEKNGEVKIATIDELLSVLHRDSPYMVSDEIFMKVLDYISLDYRGKYYDGVIKNRELHPWKYNREHSLMRKPIIKIDDNKYLWGTRNVFHSYLFIMQTIQSGKEPSHKTGAQSIQVLNGKILEFTGNDFNDYSFEYLKSIMPQIDFYKCVKSVNNLGIKNERGEILGDVDILGVDKQKKRIYLIETKNFFYSRNPSELDIEIKEMFTGDGKRKSFLEKELKRKEWFENHIDDVVQHYSLEDGKWKVVYTFLSNKPLISAFFVEQKINHTCLKKISLSYLRNIK